MKYNLANNEPLEINGDVYVKGVGTYDGTNAGESGVKTLKDILNSGVTEIIWSDLVDLRNNNELIPGQYYRITDYTCTTTQKGTKSAGHVFDIIVRADSENKLNEEARAIQHTGDEYFANNDRGKLIMACGTGKTYTSLKIAENETKNSAPRKNLIALIVYGPIYFAALD